MENVNVSIREEFAKKNNLEVSTLNEKFQENEVLRQSYLDFFAVRYVELVK